MSKDKQKTTGRRIRFFRERAGMSQMDLEIAIGASAGSISRIENGSTNPTKETLDLIADSLKLTDLQRSYTYGSRMFPVDEGEIQRATELFNSAKNKPWNFSYFYDDRYRMWGMSKPMQKLLKISDNVIEKNLGRTIIDVILDSDMTKTYFDPATHKKLIKDTLEMAYAEIGFMQDDESFQKTLSLINKHPVAKDIWMNVTKKPPILFYDMYRRNINFKVLGVTIPTTFSTFSMTQAPRFIICEYKLLNSTDE